MAKRLNGLGLGCALALLSCGASEADPRSNVKTTPSSAGSSGSATAGAAGSVSLGLGGSSGSSAGGSSAINSSGANAGGGAGPHVCGGTPEPACPQKSIAGTAVASDDADSTDIEGVTSVGGDLYVMTPPALDKLACLEKVGGNLTIDLFGDETEGTLWGLRNLKSVAGRISVSVSDRFDVDCGFSRLTTLGGDTYSTGNGFDIHGWVSGHLDLSALKLVQHVRIEETSLSKVTLPSNATLVLGQLAFIRNETLSEVAGFSGNTFVNDAVGVVEGSAYSVKITDNPRLSTCRARELAQILVAAGAFESGVIIMNDLPCAE